MIDLQLQSRALKAIAELADDREFGTRFRAGSPDSAVLAAYFSARGVDEDLALLLALAYLAGSMHAVQQNERDLDRLMRGMEL